MAKSRGAKRGRKRKNKRVAAHIKEAVGKQLAAGNNGVDNSSLTLSKSLGHVRPHKRPRDTVHKMPDPGRLERDRAEASAYLSGWKTFRKTASKKAGDEELAERWKFNKNTQAWLLRNMFTEEEVSKKSFRTMRSYLAGLQGAARQRALAHAQELIRKHGPDEEEGGAEDGDKSTPGSDDGESSDREDGHKTKRKRGDIPNEKGSRKQSRAKEGHSKKSVSFALSSDKASKDQQPEDGNAGEDLESGGHDDAEAALSRAKKPRGDKDGAESADASTDEWKVRASTIAYERALQVAELLT